jgi:hypothetical protein
MLTRVAQYFCYFRTAVIVSSTVVDGQRWNYILDRARHMLVATCAVRCLSDPSANRATGGLQKLGLLITRVTSWRGEPRISQWCSTRPNAP